MWVVRPRNAVSVAIVLALMAAASCSSSGRGGLAPPAPPATTPTTAAGPTATAGTTATTASTTTGPGVTPTTTRPAVAVTDVRVYFLRSGRIGAAHRSVAATPAIGTAAITQLLAGPTPSELAAGLRTAIPVSAGLSSLGISGGTATVDLTGQFLTAGSDVTVQARLAQVVYTLTQFPTVRGVRFEVDGRPLATAGGADLTRPASRPSFPGLAPAALIEFPGQGWAVRSPVVVSGTAAVFEGQFSAELTDRHGRVIATVRAYAPQTTAIGGPFVIRLAYPPSASGPGTVILYDNSARTGARTDLAALAVDLAG